MSVFDWLDYGLIITLYAMVFWFGGVRWRWIVNVTFLAAHLVLARYSIDVFDNPVPMLAIIHAGFFLLLLAYSQTNYGRATGLCFLAMLALDGLAMDGIISRDFHGGLGFDFWNGLSTLQHVQCLILATCFYKLRHAQWKLV